MHPALLLCCLSLSATAQTKDCSPQTSIGSWCEPPLAISHPTQQDVGLLQVEDDQTRLARKKLRALEHYLHKKETPMVIGPGGHFYLTDRYRLSSALWRLGLKQDVSVKVIGRLPQVTDFWKKIQESHQVWLHDVRGTEIPFEALLDTLAGLGDDPCRALTDYAEDENASDKGRQSCLIKFHWACYFGERVHWRSIGRVTPSDDLKQTLRLAYEPVAKELPGYRQSYPR